MLRSVQELEGYAIRATDGIIGHVRDVCFDDQKWVVRYFVVETGSWLSSRKVLISPIAIGKPDWTARVLPVAITKEQVKSSPDIDTDKPVSRQHEMQYLEYYGYPYYWGGGDLWAGAAYPGAMLTGVGYNGSGADYLVAQTNYARAAEAAEQQRQDNSDPYLRSGNELMKYDIHATDGDIGHVGGLLIDEDSWAIRYMVVNTSSWWHGQHLLVAPHWIKEVSWPNYSVVVALSRQRVKEAPQYDPAAPLSAEYELALDRHHSRTRGGAHQL